MELNCVIADDELLPVVVIVIVIMVLEPIMVQTWNNWRHLSSHHDVISEFTYNLVENKSYSDGNECGWNQVEDRSLPKHRNSCHFCNFCFWFASPSRKCESMGSQPRATSGSYEGTKHPDNSLRWNSIRRDTQTKIGMDFASFYNSAYGSAFLFHKWRCKLPIFPNRSKKNLGTKTHRSNFLPNFLNFTEEEGYKVSPTPPKKLLPLTIWNFSLSAFFQWNPQRWISSSNCNEAERPRDWMIILMSTTTSGTEWKSFFW